MSYKIILDLNNKPEKRKKALNTIFSTYRMTIRPFIADESKEYQDKIFADITKKEDDIIRMIFEKMTVETLVLYISPILDHLKDMVSTCKMNTAKLEELLK